MFYFTCNHGLSSTHHDSAIFARFVHFIVSRGLFLEIIRLMLTVFHFNFVKSVLVYNMC